MRNKTLIKTFPHSSFTSSTSLPFFFLLLPNRELGLCSVNHTFVLLFLFPEVRTLHTLPFLQGGVPPTGCQNLAMQPPCKCLSGPILFTTLNFTICLLISSKTYETIICDTATKNTSLLISAFTVAWENNIYFSFLSWNQSTASYPVLFFFFLLSKNYTLKN